VSVNEGEEKGKPFIWLRLALEKGGSVPAVRTDDARQALGSFFSISP